MERLVNTTRRHLRLAVVDDPPFSIRSNSSHLRGNAIWDGYVMHIIRSIAHHYNWTYELYQNEDNAYDTSSANNGTSGQGGVVGDVASGKADIAVAILTINEERRKDFLFSFPIWIDRFAIVVSEKANHSILWEAGNWLQEVRPRASTTAITVFALAIVCALALLGAEFFIDDNDGETLTENTDEHVRNDREETSSAQIASAHMNRTAASSRQYKAPRGGIGGNVTRAAKVFILTAEMLVRLLTLRDTPWEPASRSGRMMMNIWAAFCGIFTAVYAAQIYSAITVVKPWQPPFYDFVSMRHAGYQLMAHKLSARERMLENFPVETDEERAVLRDNLRPSLRALWPDTRQDAIRLFNSGAKVAILTGEWQARLYEDHKCDIRAIPFRYHNRSGHLVNGFQTEFSAFLVRKDDEDLVREMNVVIRQLWATGLINGLEQRLDKWNQNVLGLHTCRAKTSLMSSQVVKNEKALTLSSYSAMFWMLAQGFFIASVILVFEAGVVVCIKWSRRRTRKNIS